MTLSIRHTLAEHHIELPQIREFSPGEIAGLAFRIVQDMEVKSLMFFDICTLAEILELPLGSVCQEISVFAHITQSLVSALSKKKPLKRNEGTWLAFQIAYLLGLQQVLNQEKSLQRPWLDRAIVWDTQRMRVESEISPSSPSSLMRPLQDAQLQGLLKTLRPGKLTDTQAEQALSQVADSLLVQQMNNGAVAWLIANGAEEPEAKLIIQRLMNALAGHLLVVIAENALAFAQLQKFFRIGTSLPASPGLALHTPEVVGGLTPNPSTFDNKIDLYRELYRASLLESHSEPLLTEFFSLKDIYVPLKGLPVKENDSQQNQKIPQLDLMTWAQQQLSDLETIAVISSEPGYGKTSFCQIWAAKVAQELYPTWMPVLIRLSEVTYGNTLEETLDSGFKGNNFHLSLLEWLELEHPRCLLILDGLDELPPSRQGKRIQAIFIQQLLKFQSLNQHKIFLSSRSTALQDIAQELPQQLKRIAMEPWDKEELKQWFQQWAKVQSLPISQNFFTFLKQAGVFSAKSKLPEISALVRQPFMLYLLGVLHRDELLDEEILQFTAGNQHTRNASLLWEIYHRLSRFLLDDPQTGSIKTMLMRWGVAHNHRTQEAMANLLQGHHPQELLEKMQAVALQILHSRHSQIKLSGQLNTLPAFYFKIDTWQEGEKFLSHIQNPKSRHSAQGREPPHGSGSKIQNSLVEFSHAKLGEYLCAEALITELKLLTKRQLDAYGELTFVVDSSSVAQHLYNLLGYGILTQEIEELVIEGLRRSSKRDFSFEILCHRLLPFWYSYCRGRWLDEGIAHKALTYFQTLQNPVNIEQLNASVGLNLFLLLCAIHQEAKIPFSPCADPACLEQFNPEALLILIGKTAVLGKNTFATRIRSKSLAFLNLAGVHLPQVMVFAGVHLGQTDLSNAELIEANLAGVNLQEANLTGANLTGANLTGANLTSANLTSANLTGVNLSSVNLTNACLFQAILSQANREIALMNGALFSLEQFQAIKNLLSQQSHFNIAEATEDTAAWSKNAPQKGLIESAEGEPMMPEDLYDDYADDETAIDEKYN
ncbi:pentapeptide repeat-containing protein [Kalymmatonema gypsitolerans NIES-4073]|nr:pentapeptide repeat-containing protein [Scytonema sp. NIES-4073]